MSVSTDNFLKAIYKINAEAMENATSKKLADQLNISNAAVTDMAKSLAGKGMVKYRKYKAIELTAEGKIRALKIIRKHRLWELFLMRVLDYSWHEVHQDAEMLEHQTSDCLLERLDQYLGQPAYDPHGEPIPDKQGNIPESDGFLKLTECPEGKRYKIVKINPGTDETTRFFKENSFQLGKDLFLRKKYNDIIEIMLEKTKMVIPGSIARNIYVKP
jgi:DtxR family Mn-dependent transcriptional regulator